MRLEAEEAAHTAFLIAKYKRIKEIANITRFFQVSAAKPTEPAFPHDFKKFITLPPS